MTRVWNSACESIRNSGMHPKLISTTCSNGSQNSFSIHLGLGNVLIPYGMVQDRITKLARDMFTDFVAKGRTVLTVICVLRGASRYFNDLLEQFNRLNNCTPPDGQTLDITIEFIRVKSYCGDKSTGEVKLQGTENWKEFFR